MKIDIRISDNIKWTINQVLSFFMMVIVIPLSCYGETSRYLPGVDSVVICNSSAIVSLDPTNHRDRDTQVVIKNMFDSLTTRDRHLMVVPQLALSWQALTPTTWEFMLRKGVRFHNGDPMTAADVKFTLERVTREGAIDGHTSPRKSLLDRISHVKVIDNHTIHILTDKPWPILPLMLTLQEIVPKEYLRLIGSRGFENRPVGTGPFRFVEKLNDGTLVLERFDDYYGGSPENPPVQVAPLKQLIFKTVPDQVSRIARLKKGGADIVTNVPLEAIPLFDILPDIEVVSQPATRSYFADLNCRKPPFDNLVARVAANYAMDMRMVVNTMLQGKGRILPTILSQQAFGFNERLLPYPYDPENAREMFRHANFPMDYMVKIVCIEKYGKFANTISLFLSKVGIRSTITTGNKMNVRAAMKNMEADILVTSWGNTTLDPVGILLPKLKSNGRGNFSNYSNVKVDQLLATAESTLTSEKRDAFYKRIQEIVYNDAPMIFGYAGEEFYGVRKRIKGFAPSSTGMLSFHDVYVE